MRWGTYVVGGVVDHLHRHGLHGQSHRYLLEQGNRCAIILDHGYIIEMPNVDFLGVRKEIDSQGDHQGGSWWGVIGGQCDCICFEAFLG